MVNKTCSEKDQRLFEITGWSYKGASKTECLLIFIHTKILHGTTILCLKQKKVKRVCYQCKAKFIKWSSKMLKPFYSSSFNWSALSSGVLVNKKKT